MCYIHNVYASNTIFDVYVLSLSLSLSLSVSLDLDKWINDPPSDDDEEEVDEFKSKGSFFFPSADTDRHRRLGGSASPTAPRSKKDRKREDRKARKAEREEEEEMEKVRLCVCVCVCDQTAVAWIVSKGLKCIMYQH